MGFGGQVVSWTTQDSKVPRIGLQCRRFPPIRPKPGQKRHIGESAPWKRPDLVGWQLARAGSALVVLGKRNAGVDIYPPRHFGAVCGYQGSGHGYLAISTYQIQPGLAPCRSLALTADKLGPRGSCLALGSDFPALPRRRSWSRCRRETSRPV